MLTDKDKDILVSRLKCLSTSVMFASKLTLKKLDVEVNVENLTTTFCCLNSLILNLIENGDLILRRKDK